MGPNGFWYLGFGVAESAPIVRPWNELLKLTISVFSPDGSRTLPAFLANLIAASFASEPELQTNTASASCMQPASRVFSTSSFESAPVQMLKYKFEQCTSVFACVWRSAISNLCGTTHDLGKTNLISDDPGELRIAVA